MCIILENQNKKELSKKCTTGLYGQPFLIHSKNTVEMSFNQTEKVKEIEITFKGGQPAQIAELYIYGKLGAIRIFESC